MIKLELTLEEAKETKNMLVSVINDYDLQEDVKYKLIQLANDLSYLVNEYGNRISIIGYSRLRWNKMSKEDIAKEYNLSDIISDLLEQNYMQLQEISKTNDRIKFS